jgi:excisionase family DNA binding protein
MYHINPSLFTVTMAAEYLAVSPKTIRRWAQSRKLRGVKLGTRGDWRFKEKDLQAMLQNTVATGN